jgi:hypothetical protein
MRLLAVILFLALAAPLCAQNESARLAAEIAQLRSEINSLQSAAGEEEPGLAMRLTNNCFTWTTDDGKFALRMESMVQVTGTYHDVRANSGRGGDNGRDFWNFRVPYVRLQWTGNIFGKEFTYKVEIAPVSENGSFALEEVWFRYEPIALINVTVGQMRSAFSFESQSDRKGRTFTQRSLADQSFNQGFMKGIDICGAADLWALRCLQWHGGFANGVISTPDTNGQAQLDASSGRSRGVIVNDVEDVENLNGGFRNDDQLQLSDSFDNSVDADLMMYARFELHGMGEMARTMSELRSIQDLTQVRFMIGVAFNYFNARVPGTGTMLGNSYHTVKNSVGTTTPLPGSGREYIRAEMWSFTADGHFRGFGFFLNWAVYYRHVEFHNHGRLEGTHTYGPYFVAAVEDTGATVDAGYYILPVQTLVAARWSAVNYDEFGSQGAGGQQVDGDSFGPDSSEFGFSATWQIHGDHMKLTLDYRYVVQQMPHGVGKDKTSLNGIRRVSEYRNFQEIRLMFQWIF